jgi:16S rRNA (cytosine1402-N4)-methyltransferase
MMTLGLRSLAGALFDLGLSSLQLVDDSRGFSFRAGGRLDLRFDPSEGENAAHYLAHIDEKELARDLKLYGELRDATAVARTLVQARSRTPLETTDDLRAALKPLWGPQPHPRRLAQLHQAIRIAVNDELGRLDRALLEVPKCLDSGAVLALISYHSLEDRRVKRFFKGPPRSRREARLRDADSGDWDVLTRKVVRPTALETARNPRARSARLRAARKRRENQ